MKKKAQNNETPPWEESGVDPDEAIIEAAGLTAKAARKNASRGNRETREPRSDGDTPAAKTGKTRGNREFEPEGDTPTVRTRKTSGNRESAADEQGSRQTRPRWNPSLIGYRWVMRNISFFLFLAALAVVYIYNGHYADKISRDISRTNREVKELQYEYKTLKSEVMFRSKQSELAKAVEPFGLKELTRPPYVLTDSAKKQ